MKFFCIFAFTLLVACQLTSAGLWDNIKTVGEKAKEVGKHTASSILENSRKVAESIKSQISEKPTSFEGIKDALKIVGSEILEKASNIAHDIQDEVQKATNDEGIQKVVAETKEKMDETAVSVQSGLKRVGGKLKDAYEYVKNKKNELQENPPTLEEVKEAVKNKLNDLVGVSAQLIQKIREEIEKAKNLEEVQKVLAVAQEYVDKAAAAVDGGVKRLTEKLKEIYNSIAH